MELLSVARFEALVGDALDSLPDDLFDAMDNVSFEVADEHPDDLLGLYEGVPLPERGDYHAVFPDRIYVFRIPHCEMCDDEAELIAQVRVTVLHELAHHFGIDDDKLDELGWG
jgi:predicted Zn-dependent protease with MMP-like domain